MLKKMFLISLIGAAIFNQGNSYANMAPYYDLGIYGGYGSIHQAYKSDGHFAQGRLALGAHLKEWKQQTLGAEIGIQSGNSMRYTLPTTADSNLSLPVQTTLKPIIDLLFTVTGRPHPDKPIHYILKGGIAYRQLDIENATSSRDTLNRVAGEFQGGFGFNINQHLLLTVLYQGIYSNNNAVVSTDAGGNNFYLNQIPTQQAGFLGIQYQFS